MHTSLDAVEKQIATQDGEQEALPDQTDPLLLCGQEDPQNWNNFKKCEMPLSYAERETFAITTLIIGTCTLILIGMTATVAFSSSVYTSAISSIEQDFGTSETVSTLGVTTFLLGFATGPLLFAPLSEIWSVMHSNRAARYIKTNYNFNNTQGTSAYLLLHYQCFYYISDWLRTSPQYRCDGGISFSRRLFWIADCDELWWLNHGHLAA